jgi:hypothetical protein
MKTVFKLKLILVVILFLYACEKSHQSPDDNTIDPACLEDSTACIDTIRDIQVIECNCCPDGEYVINSLDELDKLLQNSDCPALPYIDFETRTLVCAGAWEYDICYIAFFEDRHVFYDMRLNQYLYEYEFDSGWPNMKYWLLQDTTRKYDCTIDSTVILCNWITIPKIKPGATVKCRAWVWLKS